MRIFTAVMAKQATETGPLAAKIESDIRKGDIKPFYLLFGKEHYYIDRICNLIMEHALPAEERDFGQMIYYGVDTTPEEIVSHARQFPMMVSRQVIVVKEAQGLKGVEKIDAYFDKLMPTTVLVICYKTPADSNAKNIDKRTKFYKRAGEVGVVLECEPVKEWKITGWIEDFVRNEGFTMEEGAADMIAEACGTSLSKIALAVDKLGKALAGGSRHITCKAIEDNVGMSREYSAFELAGALCEKDAAKAYRISNYFGENSKRFPIQMVGAALSSQFLKMLRYHACAAQRMDEATMAATLGLNPFIMRRDYGRYARNYPLKSCMKAVAILKEFDYRSKSNARGEASDGDLLVELVSRLLAC